MKLFYLYNKCKFPVACIASELKMSGILFAVSTYNPIDPFDKRVARDVAIGRLHRKGGKFVTAGHNVKARILQEVIADKETPARTKAAAQLWLDSHNKEKAA